MTEDRPSPAAALEAAFGRILRQQMNDVPMVNAALRVEAVGFRPWSGHWLGVLVAPWFMNLVLMPRVVARWQVIGERETRHHVFPAGVFEFIGARDKDLGDYQACSLFSPMFEFTDPDQARDTAAAALAALFDTAHPARAEVPGERAAVRDEAPAEALRTPSKREFLFGLPQRASREP